MDIFEIMHNVLLERVYGGICEYTEEFASIWRNSRVYGGIREYTEEFASIRRNLRVNQYKKCQTIVPIMQTCECGVVCDNKFNLDRHKLLLE